MRLSVISGYLKYKITSSGSCSCVVTRKGVDKFLQEFGNN